MILTPCWQFEANNQIKSVNFGIHTADEVMKTNLMVKHSPVGVRWMKEWRRIDGFNKMEFSEGGCFGPDFTPGFFEIHDCKN